MIKLLIYAAAGSALGGALRHGINICFDKSTSGSFPWHTFLINMSGSLLIGILFGLSKENQLIGENGRVFLMTGLCGGFTTFSAFSLENIQMLQGGETGKALLYITGSLAGGLLMTWAGLLCSRLWMGSFPF